MKLHGLRGVFERIRVAAFLFDPGILPADVAVQILNSKPSDTVGD